MALSPGARLGHYEIECLRGAGGMGEVYKSRDVRLDRMVAIKVLPPGVASDPEFRRRFEREARSVAAFSHPHICALYDVGEAPDPAGGGSVQFVVMEYFEGDTLEETLRRKPLPLEQVLRIAGQIADALDKAHRKNIVHRHLKPGNVMLTAGGAKLLDFGLAKVQPLAPAVEGGVTVSGPLTGRGTILGTPNYMSPEQVEGNEVDHRSDIFSFGAILYEMATGRRAFEGASAASVMAAILERSAGDDLTETPYAARIGSRCRALPGQGSRRPMAERRRHRPRAGLDRRDAGLRRGSAGGADPSRAVAGLDHRPAGGVDGSRRRLRPAGGAPSAHLREQRLEITTPASGDNASLAISPDGLKVVFVANTDGRPQLWLRSFGAVSVQPLTGTENAVLPFWSTDSRSIGFGAEGRLKRVDLDGGVRTLASAPLFLGGAWRADGRILFTPNTFSAIFSVPESGGTTAETSPSAGLGHQFPCLLPDARHFLYYTTGPPAVRGIYMAGSGGDPPRAQRRRPGDLRAAGPPAVRPSGDADVAALRSRDRRARRASRASRRGHRYDALLGFHRPRRRGVHSRPDRVPDRRLTGPRPRNPPVGRPERRGPAAARQGAVVLHQPGALAGRDSYGDVRQRRHLALRSGHGRAQPLHLRPRQRLRGGVSPDGRQVVFASNRRGPYDLYLKNASGAGGESPLFQNDARKIPSDWSHDGRFLLFDTWSEKTTFYISALAMPEGKPFTVPATEFEERNGQISPDGRWLAYQSNESGRFEIWIRPFPVKSDERWQFSTGGGRDVRWRRDGKEIFYVGLDGRLVAVPVLVEEGGRAPTPGLPVTLFSVGAPILGGGTAQPWYSVTSDGRFLVADPTQPPVAVPVKVLLNWK